MNDFESRLLRTWTTLLVEANYPEVAAIVVDADLEILNDSFEPYGVAVGIPPSAYPYVAIDPGIKRIIEDTLSQVVIGRLNDQNGNPLAKDAIEIAIRVKLLDADADWQQQIKEQIANAKNPNQALISEKVFARERKQVIKYNEMKFGSQSEIRIAQELEKRKVLFFPLPLAVRNDTGVLYKDHREPDFLVCDAGLWGVLEVSYHPDRWEKDAEKYAWFKDSGILCVEAYTAERCYDRSEEVVAEFLGRLAQHRK